jgi:hypothetical protein
LQERLINDLLSQLPDVERQTYSGLLRGFLSELPDLTAPLMASGLSLEVLLEAIGSEERKTTVKTSSETLKAKADQRKITNEKELAEIKERMETLEKEKALSPFQKFFKYLGMALGAIASIATIALGAMTGNPLMVAAGVMMAVMVVDSILSEATEGKYCISGGVAAAAEACGADEETARWIAFGVSCALTVASIALSFGAAGAANGVEATTKIMNFMVKLQQASNVISGVTAIGSGACGVAQAVFDYEIAESQATTKELEAILERIRESIETEEDFLKFVMEKFEGLATKVSGIVKESHEAQLAVQTGQAPLA